MAESGIVIADQFQNSSKDKEMVLDIVLSQIDAWNEGNFEELLNYYSETIQVLDLSTNKTIFASKAEIISHIKPDFENNKVDQINVISKVESNPYVVLVEEKQLPAGPKKTMFIYLVQNNKIQKMWIAS